jgi:hypothetical protein
MIQTTDTIDGSGDPLAFKVNAGTRVASVLAGAAGRDVFRVEARAMGAHQKEALVTEGDGGTTWRVASDEGPYLHGTDVAPFPLGFFNAGLQAELLHRLLARGAAHGVRLDAVAIDLDNRYAFEGSFHKGTGRGSAQPPEARFTLRSGTGAERVAQVVLEAVSSSPLLAALRTPLANTFALYVNGKRREVVSAEPSAAPDAPDPLKTDREPPRPLAADGPTDLIVKLPAHGKPAAGEPMSASSRAEIGVLGHGRLIEPALAEHDTWLARPPGSRFRFRAAVGEAAAGAAPSGLALAAAGIAFCYMTQLVRYIGYLKYRVRAIRLVQLNPFGLASNGAALTGEAGPVDTHLFLHGDEPDDVMQRLLAMGANTCYLHASLGAALQASVHVTLNGAAVPRGLLSPG